jgi:hypothetical protein
MPDKVNSEFLRTSQLVVAGTVEKMNAATMAIDPAISNAGVFKIEEILRGPKVIAGFVGKEITVIFRDAGVGAGERMILYATSWTYGESLAVLEVGRTTDTERSAMRQEIEDADRRLADERLTDRIRIAEIVATGRVEKTQPRPMQGPPLSEHDPLWWEALISAESYEKGRHEGLLTILFPSSVDIAWSQSPKFHSGQEGIWILQRDQRERGARRFRLPGLTALDPLDFHPKTDRAHIRSLVRKAR